MYIYPEGKSEAWKAEAYLGLVARFRSLSSVRDLVGWVKGLCEARWADPQMVHLRYDGEALTREISEAQNQLAQAEEAARLWRAVFEEAGLDPGDTYRDRLQIRVQPPITNDGKLCKSAKTVPLPLHRDTWASNVPAQINWWGPVYPIEDGRTMAIYPGLWDVPIPNSSADFDFAAARMRRRRADQDLSIEELLPVALNETCAEQSPVLLVPGEVIAFSGHHAHASVPNRTPLTRISIETRTVSLCDLMRGVGAPDIDGSGKSIVRSLFKRVSDRAPLPELLQ